MSNDFIRLMQQGVPPKRKAPDESGANEIMAQHKDVTSVLQQPTRKIAMADSIDASAADKAHGYDHDYFCEPAHPDEFEAYDMLGQILKINAAEARDFATVVRVRPGVRAAKKWISLESKPDEYGEILWVKVVEERPVNSILDLSAVLREIEPDPSLLLIRGRLRPDWEQIQELNLPAWTEKRRKDDEANAKKEQRPVTYRKPLVPPGPGWVLRRKALFEDVPHHWALFDSDKFRPATDPLRDPEGAALEYAALLPPEFQGTSMHLQLSNSAGLTSSAGLFKAHVWYWFDKPHTGAQLTAWAEATWPDKDERKLRVDTAVFDCIQIHYTSRPVMGVGVSDPVPKRSFYLDGGYLNGDEVALQMPTVAMEAKATEVSSSDLVDPRTKAGVQGAYCRAFELETILADHIPGVFDWATDTRLTWLGGGGAAEGAFVRGDRQGIGASHNSWPWGTNRVVNKWDLVRHFKFGHLDASEDDLEAAVLRNSAPQHLPSHAAMCEWAKALPEVADALADFAGGREALDAARREHQKRENQMIGEGAFKIPVAEVVTLDTALSRFVFLSDGSRVADIFNPHYDLAYPDWAATYAASKMSLPQPDKELANGNMKKTPDKVVAVSELWRGSAGRRTVVCRTYKAGGSMVLSDPQGRLALNIWKPFDRSTEVTDLEAAGVGLFLEHINFLFGKDAGRFLDWLAHIEQQPGVLPHTAWLHIAHRFGMGRNWLASVLSRVWSGGVAANFDMVSMFKSGFNGSLSRKVLAIVDEIREGGRDSQWEHSEKLKSLITEETRTINPKFGRQTVEFNSCRWLMFSNHLSAIPLERGDRRVEVVQVDAEPRDAAYYTRLYNALADSRFIAAVATYLGQRDISAFNPGAHAAMTEAKRSAALASQTPTALWCELLVEHWPCDVAPSQVLAGVLGAGIEGGLNAGHRRALEQVGVEALGSPIKIDGKSQRMSLIRNKAKWKGATPAEVRSEWSRGLAALEGVYDYQEHLMQLAAGEEGGGNT